ncbi:hypothetical protein [Methylobacterium hispanicum]|uniref:hypothetical protein n=1 Tax=Methylobacterium hispanicum TaxID=270350 RepID=UPI002F2F6922
MLYAAYYAALRALLGSADAGKKLAYVALGSSALSPNAEVAGITDRFLTPIRSITYDPDNPRLMTINFLVAQDEAVGLVVREVGLVTADGTLVYRRVRSPIEKTADDELGSRIILQV